MPFKIFWFNKEMMIQSFRNVGWVGIIYLVGLFFALPLQVIMEWSKRKEYGLSYYNHFHNVFSILFELQLVLMVAVPIFLAIFLFRFLQMKSASDFMHSLPIKRTTLYRQYTGIGILYLVVPIIITAIVLMIINSVMGLNVFYTNSQVFSWAGITGVIVILVFVTSVFVGTVTGLSVVQGVLSLILLLFPAGIMALIVLNLDLFLLGFLPNYYLEYDLVKLSPITDAAVNLPTKINGISLIQILFYLLFIILFYVMGIWIYKKRNLESVSQAIVFPQLKPVFKYGVTFCTMLFGGFYFGETQNSMSWAIFGYVIGSLIGYFIAEMVLQKTWRVFTHMKGYFIYAVAICVLGFLIHLDVLGYQQRVPELSQIERVYFANSSFGYINAKNNNNAYVVDQPIYKYKPFFYETKNINAIRNLHRQIIKNKNMVKNPIRSTIQPVFIAYELKDGQKVVRQYQLPKVAPFEKYLKEIYNSKEYKEAKFEVLHVKPGDVDQIRISPNLPINKAAIITDQEVISKAIAALKADVMNQTYNPDTKNLEGESSIMILLNDDHNERINMPYDPSYKQFQSVLKKQKLLQEALVSPVDISFAVVVKKEDVENKISQDAPTSSRVQQMLENKKALKITSKDQIKQLWNGSVRDSENDYLVGFQFKEEDYEEIKSFGPENAPEFITHQMD